MNGLTKDEALVIEQETGVKVHQQLMIGLFIKGILKGLLDVSEQVASVTGIPASEAMGIIMQYLHETMTTRPEQILGMEDIMKGKPELISKAVDQYEEGNRKGKAIYRMGLTLANKRAAAQNDKGGNIG